MGVLNGVWCVELWCMILCDIVLYCGCLMLCVDLRCCFVLYSVACCVALCGVLFFCVVLNGVVVWCDGRYGLYCSVLCCDVVLGMHGYCGMC